MYTTNSAVFRKSVPELTVQARGNHYVITSDTPFSMERFEKLRDLGVVGYGQTFNVHQVGPGRERIPVPAKLDRRYGGDTLVPTRVEPVPCVDEDHNGNVVKSPAVNPYTGVPYNPSTQEIFVYELQDIIDSSG